MCEESACEPEEPDAAYALHGRHRCLHLQHSLTFYQEQGFPLFDPF